MDSAVGPEHDTDPHVGFLQKIKTRRGRLCTLTKKKNELKIIIKRNENTAVVRSHVRLFHKLLFTFRRVHEDVQGMLEEEDMEADHAEWYEPKIRDFESFADQMEAWLEGGARADGAGDGDAGAEMEGAGDAEVDDAGDGAGAGAAAAAGDGGTGDRAGAWTSSVGSAAEEEDIDVGPSVSEASAAVSSTRSSSRLAEACLKAEAEKAALCAKIRTLEQKHILDLEQANLTAKQERLALSAELAAAEAKSRLLWQSLSRERSCVSTAKASAGGAPGARSGAKAAVRKSKFPVKREPVNDVEPGVETEINAPCNNVTEINAPSNNVTEINAPSNNVLVDVLRRQNEITEMLIKQQRLALLPSRDIPVFDGDPLHFGTFIRAFQQGIDSKTDNVQDKLYYLEQYTSGQPRQLVRSCLHMEPSMGYRKAMEQLEWHFGNKMKITAAFMSKALGWCPIKAEDGAVLRSYLLFLQSCYNTMSEINYVDELENAANMQIIVSKLPYKLRDNWRMTVGDIQGLEKRRANFKDFLHFMEKVIRAVLDPVFGEANLPVTVQRAKPKVQQRDMRRSSFATTVATIPELNKLKKDGEQNKKQSSACMFCGKDHKLEIG